MPLLPTCLCLIALGTAEPTQPDRPNFLIILADDLGKEWLSCYGSQGHKTPNLDRLAAGGIRFESVYATPLCTPTRHELLTGRYPFRTGWTVHHDAPRWGGQYFDWNREITFARALKSAGYATAIAGKWQVNDLRTHPDALQRHGFDEHCLWTGFETGNPPSDERYFDPFIQHNGRRRTHEGRFGPEVFAEFLIDFMTRHKDQPFCAYYAMVLTHTPFTKTPHNLDTQAEKIALFPGMVDYTDYLVQRLVATLDRLDIRKRTFVIFTADNGTVSGVECRAKGHLVDGGKGTLTERGICVPFIVNCPGRVPAGQVSEHLVDFSDLFPTLIELAGARPPDGVAIDGRSFADVLLARPDSRPRRRWIYSQLGRARVIRDQRFKLWSDSRFYDLTNDPMEEKNLADSDSPQVKATRDRLATALNALPEDAKLPWPPHKKER